MSKNKLTIRPSHLEGAAVVDTLLHGDERGSFSRFFCTDELKPLLNNRSIVAANHSFTKEKGTIRGLHYQNPPFAEFKLY